MLRQLPIQCSTRRSALVVSELAESFFLSHLAAKAYKGRRRCRRTYQRQAACHFRNVHAPTKSTLYARPASNNWRMNYLTGEKEAGERESERSFYRAGNDNPIGALPQYSCSADTIYNKLLRSGSLPGRRMQFLRRRQAQRRCYVEHRLPSRNATRSTGCSKTYPFCMIFMVGEIQFLSKYNLHF
jgi:hypothetical protein